MRTLRFLAAIMFVVPTVLSAQSATPEAQAIRAVLDKQVVDWNRGDMESFATGYKNSPDILFMGSKISRGYAQMVDTYRKNYSTKEKMGILGFTNLEVQPLDERFATVTGNFHLERTEAGEATPMAIFCSYSRKRPADGRSFATQRLFRRRKLSNNHGSPECEGGRCRRTSDE